MTFEKTDRRRRTPQDKLASRSWRVLHSWWILVPLLSIGMVPWLGFFVAGVQLGRAKYWISTAVYVALWVVMFLTADEQAAGLRDAVFSLTLVLCWFGATVQSAAMNRRYLIELAHRRTWYESGPVAPPMAPANPGPAPSQTYYAPAGYTPAGHGPGASPPGQWSTPDPARAAPAAPPLQPPPWSRPPGPAAQEHPAPAGWSRRLERPVGVDVNRASPQELAAVGPLGAELAGRIVATREARGPFRDLDDLAFTLGLQPHQLVQLREQLVVRPTSPPAESAGGRLLDF